MKLNSRKLAVDDHTPVILSQGKRRIEFFIAKDGPDSFTLFAFAGTEALQASRSKSQGPYQALSQALAARNAILTELMDLGFQLEPQAKPIWELNKQKQLNQLRKQKLKAVNTKFKPEDVFLDW